MNVGEKRKIFHTQLKQEMLLCLLTCPCSLYNQTLNPVRIQPVNQPTNHLARLERDFTQNTQKQNKNI